MSDERLRQLVERHPRGKRVQADIAAGMRGWHSDQIEKHCIDVLPSCLIDACVLFFQLHPSTEARVSSIVDNDLFLVAAVLLCTLRDPATLARQSAERRECLDLIEELLVRVSTKATQLRSTVYRELTTAAFLAVALQNVHLGRDLQDRLRDSTFLSDELYALLRATSLHEFVDEMRRSVLTQG